MDERSWQGDGELGFVRLPIAAAAYGDIIDNPEWFSRICKFGVGKS